MVPACWVGGRSLLVHWCWPMVKVGGGLRERSQRAVGVSDACSPMGQFKDWGSQVLHQERWDQVVPVGDHRAGAGC